MAGLPHNVKRATLTSKKNWWLVQADDDDEPVVETRPRHHASGNSYSSADTAVSPISIAPSTAMPDASKTYSHHASSHRLYRSPANPSLSSSPQLFSIPRHPSAIFSFPTPTTYAAPPEPTANLAPFAQGSASELFKCVVKKPEVVQLEINGEMQSNATDVTTQFLAELRVYTTLPRNRNIAAFLGCLEGLGLVLEYIEGHTLYDAIRSPPPSLPLTRERKIDYHNQLLSGLCHLHAYGLSHGDLSLLNVHVSSKTDTIKLLDFGRSVAADSVLIPPDAEPVDPFAHLHAALEENLRQTRGRNAFSRSNTMAGIPAAPAVSGHGTLPTTPRPGSGPRLGFGFGGMQHHIQNERRIEQIHPGTRPFSAPEILRGECEDAMLADAYSFGMILVCLDREETVDVKPWDQRKELLPKGFFDKCTIFGERAIQYLKKWGERRRLEVDDQMSI